MHVTREKRNRAPCKRLLKILTIVVVKRVKLYSLEYEILQLKTFQRVYCNLVKITTTLPLCYFDLTNKSRTRNTQMHSR